MIAYKNQATTNGQYNNMSQWIAYIWQMIHFTGLENDSVEDMGICPMKVRDGTDLDSHYKNSNQRCISDG